MLEEAGLYKKRFSNKYTARTRNLKGNELKMDKARNQNYKDGN